MRYADELKEMLMKDLTTVHNMEATGGALAALSNILAIIAYKAFGEEQAPEMVSLAINRGLKLAKDLYQQNEQDNEINF